MIANPEYKCKKCGEVFIDISNCVSVLPNPDGKTIHWELSDLNLFVAYKKIPLSTVHSCDPRKLGIAELIGVNLGE